MANTNTKKKAPAKKVGKKKPASKKAPAKKKKTKSPNPKTLPILTAVCILLAIIFLCGSLPGLIPWMRGQIAPTAASDLSAGRYVQLTVDNVLDIYAENYNTSQPDTVTGYVAVMKLGDQLISVRLPARLYAGADSLRQQTQAEYQSGGSAPASDILVYGTVAKADSDTLGLLYTWYSNNSSWLSAAGLTASGADASTVISNYVVKADALGGFPNLWSFWIVAGLAILFILAAFVLSIAGGGLKRAPEGKPVKTTAEKTKENTVKKEDKDEKNNG